MHLESRIVIHRQPDEVWKFLGSVESVPKWDRGVVRATTTKATPAGVGTEFNTFARTDSDWGKMSYRVAERGPSYCKVQLTSHDGNARFVKDGCWTFRTEPHPEGTLVACCVDFSVKFRYLFLAPLLYLKRSAILTDLEFLRRAIESEPAANPNE